MAYASLPPLPVSADQVRGRFAGLDRYLVQMAQREVPGAPTADAAVAAVIARHIRSAMRVLEEGTHTPFFMTRFCTQELASQDHLTLGTDYDVELQPLDYQVNQWRSASGRTELPRMPVKVITTMRLSLGNGGKIADIPNDWLNTDRRKGVIHILPNALTSLSATFFTIFAIHPMLLRPGLGETTPMLVHLRYTAGLCERTATDGVSVFDPTGGGAGLFNTPWDQQEVADYQAALESLAALPIARKILPSVTRGGISLGVDGLSRSVNAQTLRDDMKEWQVAVQEFTTRERRQAIGVGAVFV